MSLRRMMCTQLATEEVEPPAAWVTSPGDEHAASAEASVRAALTPEGERRIAARVAEDERRAALRLESLDEERRRRV